MLLFSVSVSFKIGIYATVVSCHFLIPIGFVISETVVLMIGPAVTKCSLFFPSSLLLLENARTNETVPPAAAIPIAVFFKYLPIVFILDELSLCIKPLCRCAVFILSKFNKLAACLCKFLVSTINDGDFAVLNDDNDDDLECRFIDSIDFDIDKVDGNEC